MKHLIVLVTISLVLLSCGKSSSDVVTQTNAVEGQEVRELKGEQIGQKKLSDIQLTPNQRILIRQNQTEDKRDFYSEMGYVYDLAFNDNKLIVSDSLSLFNDISDLGAINCSDIKSKYPDTKKSSPDYWIGYSPSRPNGWKEDREVTPITGHCYLLRRNDYFGSAMILFHVNKLAPEKIELNEIEILSQINRAKYLTTSIINNDEVTLYQSSLFPDGQEAEYYNFTVMKRAWDGYSDIRFESEATLNALSSDAGSFIKDLGQKSCKSINSNFNELRTNAPMKWLISSEIMPLEIGIKKVSAIKDHCYLIYKSSTNVLTLTLFHVKENFANKKIILNEIEVLENIVRK